MIHKSNYMTARIWIIRAASMIGTIILFIYGLCYCNRLLINKSSYNQYASFFDSEQDFDVLFFGSSHVYNGVSPLYLYQKYGITSYNVSAVGNYIPSNYYLLKEILKSLERTGRQMPETIAMDVYPEKDSTDWLHLGWDSFPIFPFKLEMANALVSKEDRFEILLPFSLYHGRWNGLSEDDFLPKVNQLYGQGAIYGLSYPDSEIITNPLDQTEPDEETADYINRMEAECEEYGIQLILIHIPYSYRPDLQRKANGICKYAEEQGIRCVNYMNMDTAIDYDIDFHDTGHLNIAGMKIITDELGRLLSEIGLEDHRWEDEAQAGQWEQAYETYIQVRIDRLIEVDNMKIYLMALNDPDLISTVRICEDMLDDIQISKLIDRLRAEDHQIIVTKEQPEITLEGEERKKYDVYCEVYRRSSPEAAIHKAGFVL